MRRRWPPGWERAWRYGQHAITYLSRLVTPVMYKMLPPAVLRRPMQATPVPA